MEPHISNILRGTRQFFQALPTSSADGVGTPSWPGPMSYTSQQRTFADPAAGRPPWPGAPSAVPAPPAPVGYGGYPEPAERRRSYWDLQQQQQQQQQQPQPPLQYSAPSQPPDQRAEHVVMVMENPAAMSQSRAALQATLRHRSGLEPRPPESAWPRPPADARLAPPQPTATVSTELSGLYEFYGRKQQTVAPPRHQPASTPPRQQRQQQQTVAPPRHQPASTPPRQQQQQQQQTVPPPRHQPASTPPRHQQQQTVPPPRHQPASTPPRQQQQQQQNAMHRVDGGHTGLPMQAPSPLTIGHHFPSLANHQPPATVSNHRQSPAAQRQSPATHRQSPAGHSQSPAAHRQSPAGHSQSPAGHSQFPAARRQSPAANRQSPASHSQSSAAAVHLPASAAAVHLPASAAAVHLPSSAAAVHLPFSAAAVHLPSSAAAVHLPSTAAAVHLPSPAAHSQSRPSSAQGRPGWPAASDLPSVVAGGERVPSDVASAETRRTSSDGQLLDLRPIDTGQPRKRLSSEVLDLSVKSRDSEEERPRSVVPSVSRRSVTPQQRPESVPAQLADWSTVASVGNGTSASPRLGGPCTEPAKSHSRPGADRTQRTQHELLAQYPAVSRSQLEVPHSRPAAQASHSAAARAYAHAAGSRTAMLAVTDSQAWAAQPPLTAPSALKLGVSVAQSTGLLATSLSTASTGSASQMMSQSSPHQPRPWFSTAPMAGPLPPPPARAHDRQAASPFRSSHAPVGTDQSPARPVHPPLRSGHSPVRSGHSPVRSGHSPVRSGHSPVRSGHSPVRSGHSPVRSVHSPVRSRQSPARMGHSPVCSESLSGTYLPQMVSKPVVTASTSQPGSISDAVGPYHLPATAVGRQPLAEYAAASLHGPFYPPAFSGSQATPRPTSMLPQVSHYSSIQHPHLQNHAPHPYHPQYQPRHQAMHQSTHPSSHHVSYPSSYPASYPSSLPSSSSHPSSSQRRSSQTFVAASHPHPSLVPLRLPAPQPASQPPPPPPRLPQVVSRPTRHHAPPNGPAGSQRFTVPTSQPQLGTKRPHGADDDRPNKVARGEQRELDRRRQPSGDLPEASSLEEILRLGILNGAAGHSPQDLAQMFPNMAAAVSSPEKPAPAPPPPPPSAARELDIYQSVTSFINDNDRPPPCSPPRVYETLQPKTGPRPPLPAQPAPQTVALHPPPLQQQQLTAPWPAQPRGPAPQLRPPLPSPGRPRPPPEPLQVAGAPVEFRRARGPFLTPEQERCLQGQLSRYERKIHQVATECTPSAAAAARVRTKAEMKGQTAATESAKPPRQSTSTESNKSVFDFESGSDGEVPVLSHKTQARPVKPEPPKVDVFGDSLDSSFWGSVCDSLAENIQTNQKLVKSKRVTRNKIVHKLQQLTGGGVKEELAEEEPERLTPPLPSEEAKPGPANGEATSDSAPPPAEQAEVVSKETTVKQEENMKEEAAEGEQPTKPEKKVEQEKTDKPKEDVKPKVPVKQTDNLKQADTGSEYELSEHSGEEDEGSTTSGSGSQHDSSEASGGRPRRRPVSRRRGAADSESDSDVEVRRRRRPARAVSSASSSDGSRSEGQQLRGPRRHGSSESDRAARRVTRSRGSRRMTRQSRRLVLKHGLPARRRPRAARGRSESAGSASDAQPTPTPKPRRGVEPKRPRGRPPRSLSAESSHRPASSSPRKSTRGEDNKAAQSTKPPDGGSVARRGRPGRPPKRDVAARSAAKTSKSPARSDTTGDRTESAKSTPTKQAVPKQSQRDEVLAVEAGPNHEHMSSDEDTASRSVADTSQSVAAAAESDAGSTGVPSILDVRLPRLTGTDILVHYCDDHRTLLRRIDEVLTRQQPRARFPRIPPGGAHLWTDDWQRLFVEWKTGVCRVPKRLVVPPRRPAPPPTTEATPPTTPRKSAARRERAAAEPTQPTTTDSAEAAAPCANSQTEASQASSRFTLRQASPTVVDVIEAKLVESVQRRLPLDSDTTAASDSIVGRLLRRYVAATELPAERRVVRGTVFREQPIVLRHSLPAMLATPRTGAAPAAAALLFRPETVQRFPAELADSPLAAEPASTAAAAAVNGSAVVLDSRTRGARAQLTEKELLREVFGVERNNLLRKPKPRKTPLKKPRPAAAPALPPAAAEGCPAGATSGPGPPRTPRIRRRRNKNRSSGFDFLLKRKRRKEADAEPATRNKRHLASDGPRMGADVTGSAELAAEIRSWALNRSAGETALLRAAKLGYLDAVIYLLETGEDVAGCRDNASFTPLHEACARGHLDVAKALLLYGADVNVSARGGVRPLHEAVENNHPEVVRLLLGYGSDPGLPTYSGLSPLELAAGMTTMTMLLRGHIDDVEGSTSGGWRMAAASALEGRPSGLELWRHAPPYLPRPDDTHLTFDISATPLPDIYRSLCDTASSGGVRYVTLSSLARHLQLDGEHNLLRQFSDLHVVEMAADSAHKLVCQTVNGWRLGAVQSQAATVKMVRLDRDVEALLRRDRFNMAV